MNLLTIIVTASFIRSHPSIKIIKETIESLELINMPSNTEIILAHDYNDHINYKKYFENLNEYIKPFCNIKIVMRDTKGCLTGNIKNALEYVNSKYILVIQHDLPFIKELDIKKVMCDMDKNMKIKYVRFNKRKNIKCASDARNDLFGLQEKGENYTYTRTPSWSDNNHLCLKIYYMNVVMKECRVGGFMEHTLTYKNNNEETHKKYGTYIYGGLNHPQVIKHTDGRNTR